MLPLLGPASDSLAPRPRQLQLLELQRLLAGQSLDSAGHMTLAVAVQHLRDRAEEEVPLSDGGAQRQTHYWHLKRSLDPCSLLASTISSSLKGYQKSTYSFGMWLREQCWYIAALVLVSMKHIRHR